MSYRLRHVTYQLFHTDRHPMVVVVVVVEG